MVELTRLSENIALIQAVLAEESGDPGLFAQRLRQRQIPHLSFSQITSVEFCHYQYFLQYILAVEPSPMPAYFSKGKVLHEVIAASYSRLGQAEKVDTNGYEGLVDRHFNGEHSLHLKNAIRLHLDHLWQDCEVLAVEQPFVMELEEGLFPCVGVIDLVLRQGDQVIVIDHKTGRDFYPQDVLQMAIYHEYVQRQFPAARYSFYYDSYRWVKNLKRIRKPAFQRTEVTILDGFWQKGLERLRQGQKQIDRIRQTNAAVKNGECFRCPYRRQCW